MRPREAREEVPVERQRVLVALAVHELVRLLLECQRCSVRLCRCVSVHFLFVAAELAVVVGGCGDRERLHALLVCHRRGFLSLSHGSINNNDLSSTAAIQLCLQQMEIASSKKDRFFRETFFRK